MAVKTLIAIELSEARLMAKGTREHASEMNRFGDAQERADKIEAVAEELAALDDEHKTIKSAQQRKTEEVVAKRKELRETLAATKKIAKMSVGRADYASFGISSSSGQSLADDLQAARLMAKGTREHAEAMSEFGDANVRADKIERLADELAALDSEQEAMKSALHRQTASVKAKRAELKVLVSETKMIARRTVRKSDYASFGISPSKHARSSSEKTGQESEPSEE